MLTVVRGAGAAYCWSMVYWGSAVVLDYSGCLLFEHRIITGFCSCLRDLAIQCMMVLMDKVSRYVSVDGVFPHYVYEYLVDDNVRYTSCNLRGMVSGLYRSWRSAETIDRLLFDAFRVHVTDCGTDYNSYTGYGFLPLGTGVYYTGNVYAVLRVNADGSREYGVMCQSGSWARDNWFLVYSSDYDMILGEIASDTVTDWEDYTGALALLSMYRVNHELTDGRSDAVPFHVFADDAMESGLAGMREFLDGYDCEGFEDELEILNRLDREARFMFPEQSTVTLDYDGVPTTRENEIFKRARYWLFPEIDAANQELYRLSNGY